MLRFMKVIFKTQRDIYSKDKQLNKRQINRKKKRNCHFCYLHIVKTIIICGVPIIDSPAVIIAH